MVLWCSSYHYCTTSFNKSWTQLLHRFKSCWQHVGDSRWWGSLTMILAENKAKPPPLVKHTTKTIHLVILFLKKDSLFFSSKNSWTLSKCWPTNPPYFFRLNKIKLAYCNWTQTHNHLVHKQTLNHLAKLAKWLSYVVSTYLYSAFDMKDLNQTNQISQTSKESLTKEFQFLACATLLF